MARKMNDDEIMDYTYNKLFGDLDRIESDSMFNSEGDGLGAPQEVADNAGTPGLGGIDISIKPIMKGASEGERDPEGGKPEPENEDEVKADKLKGISRMSPLMSQLHGER